jgi:hypothetical protein
MKPIHNFPLARPQWLSRDATHGYRIWNRCPVWDDQQQIWRTKSKFRLGMQLVAEFNQLSVAHYFPALCLEHGQMRKLMVEFTSTGFEVLRMNKVQGSVSRKE